MPCQRSIVLRIIFELRWGGFPDRRSLADERTLANPGLTIVDDAIFVTGVGLVLVWDLTVDSAPSAFLLDATAVVEEEGASDEVAEPEYPRVAVVAVPVAFASQISVHDDLRLVAPPFGGNVADGLPDELVYARASKRVAFHPSSPHLATHLEQFGRSDVRAETNWIPMAVCEEKLERVHFLARPGYPARQSRRTHPSARSSSTRSMCRVMYMRCGVEF